MARPLNICLTLLLLYGALSLRAQSPGPSYAHPLLAALESEEPLEEGPAETLLLDSISPASPTLDSIPEPPTHDAQRRLRSRLDSLAAAPVEWAALRTDPFYSDNDPWGIFPGRHLILPVQRPDRADYHLDRRRHFWRAAAEVFGMNMSLWAYDRYVQHGHYAYINLHTIKENFRHGFSWDNDHLGTNMFAHPYNGSLFYNAGRSNGFNFWQSGLFAVAGSAQWEMFMEREYPSTNDIIATPIGGAALGEVFYRTSDLFLDERTTGWERFEREAAAFIISPMRGITRLVTGRMWRRSVSPGRRFGLPPVSLSIGIGARAMLFHDDGDLSKMGATMLLNLEYGDRYQPASRRPYDYFKILAELDAIKTQPVLNRLEINGRLWSRELLERPGTDLSLGIYQHFDFFDSDTITRRENHDILLPCVVPYKLGTPASAGVGLMWRKVTPGLGAFEGYAHVNAVALAGILSDYYRFYHRNYNWASGYSLKLGLSAKFPRQGVEILVADRLYNLFTWKGWYRAVHVSVEEADRAMDVQGDSSTAWFNYLEFRFNYRIWQRLYASLGLDWYWRKTNYHKLEVYNPTPADGQAYVTDPRITSNQLGIYLMATWEF